MSISNLDLFQLFGSARFRDFRKKTPKRTWLCAGISPVRYALQTRKSLKRHGKSFSLHWKKNFLVGGRFFMSDVISEGLLGHLGPLCLALGVNR